MPEILEVERYARLARGTIGRTVTDVDTPDHWFLKHGADADAVRAVAVGATIVGVRRIGKLLLLDLRDRPTLGLRFGMTGRLFVDGVAGIDGLEYGTSRVDPAWERFRMHFADGVLVMHDPRRLGGVEIAPDETKLGADAWSLDRDALARALAKGRGPLKARLLDQSRVAGLGNLLTDETLWRARLAPERGAGSLSEEEIDLLHRTIRQVLDELDARGGSHRGDLQGRHPGGPCPRCATTMSWRATGGRSTYWCEPCVTDPR